MKKLGFALLLILISNVTQAQVRKYSNESLNIGIGARALGLGSAYTAIADDITAAYWNPAGLCGIKEKFQVGLMHNEYFGGIGKHDYLALGIPINTKKISSVLAFSYVRFSVDNIPNTFNLIDADGGINYDNVTFFSQSDNLYLISYAWKINKKSGFFDWNNLSMGANAKIINRKAGPFAKSWGMGIDIAARYNYRNIHAGVMFSDVTTTYNAWSFTFTDEQKAVLAKTNNIIPINTYELTAPSIRFGGSYDLLLLNQDLRLSPILDFTMTTDKTRNVLFRGKSLSVDPAIGIESGYRDFVFVRLGLNNFTRFTKPDATKKERLTAEPNIGLGLKFKSIAIDYAFTNVADKDKLYSHVISARIAINRKPNEKEVNEATYDYQKDEAEVDSTKPTVLKSTKKSPNQSNKNVNANTNTKPNKPTNASSKNQPKSDFIDDNSNSTLKSDTTQVNKVKPNTAPKPTVKPTNKVSFARPGDAAKPADLSKTDDKNKDKKPTKKKPTKKKKPKKKK